LTNNVNVKSYLVVVNIFENQQLQFLPKSLIYLSLSLFLLFISCKNPVNFDEIKRPDNSSTVNAENAINVGRLSWQKPGFVIDQLGDLTGKTVADIGAGSGYFSFRMSYKNAHVIAVDIDEDMIDMLELQRMNMPLELQQRFEARLAMPDHPPLRNEEVDHVIIINTIAYFDNQLDYLKQLKDKLKTGGKLLIVDYKMKHLDIPAPSQEDRIPLQKVEQLLISAGYIITNSDDTNLEYQYLVIGEKI